MSINVEKYEYRVEIDVHNPNYYLSADMGQAKGDLIVFQDAGAPTRLSAGSAADKVLVTDPTSDTGWTMKAYNAGGGGGGGGETALITLKNESGATIDAGTVVTFDEEGGEREIRKATSVDEDNLFITSDDVETGEEVDCYAYPNTICNVMCDEEAVAVGDHICVGTTAGLGTAGEFATIGLALTAKAAGLNGLVKVLLMNYERHRYTVSTVDLEDGVSTLTTGHFYYYYEASEPEE